MSNIEVVNLVKELIQIDSRNPFELEKKKGKYYQGSRDAMINKFLRSKLK